VADLNALSVLTPRKLLVTKAALDAIKEKYQAKKPKAEPSEAKKSATGKAQATKSK
jgi:hypothetical protein